MGRSGLYCGLILSLTCSTLRAQAWKTDIGYTALQTRLGGSTPTGSGIGVTQVEAPAGGSNPMWIYRPDPANAEFVGKGFSFECGTCDNTATSSHATTVGTYLYGTATSIAPGIITIDANEANNWVNGSLAPNPPSVEDKRIQNHAWISPSISDEIIRRFDLMLDRDGVVGSVGVNNGAASVMPPLLSSSYNAISVGLTSGGSSYGPVIAGQDGAGRVKPDIVTPTAATSWGTGVISGASALLLQTADALNILNALTAAQRTRGKAMLAKAMLMAGATKSEFAGMGGWRKGFASPSTNGAVPLDYRFGAGELNIDNSHRILTTNPQQTPSGSALRTSTGWNFTTIGGGGTHQYFFEVPSGNYITALSCVLTWNRRVNISGPNVTPGLANMDLRLFEASGFVKGAQRDLSVSTLDNVEHIWMQNLTAGRYLLEVTAASPLPLSASTWEYAIAWQTQTAAATLPPDLDHDGDVDADDLTLFKACRSRSNVPRPAGCAAADFNNDNDVDPRDFATWQRCHSGKGVIAPSTCYQP